MRPDSAAIARLLSRPPAEGEQAAAIVGGAGTGVGNAGAGDVADADPGTVEVLASGLAFDLEGVAPAGPSAPPEVRFTFGLPGEITELGLEGITLVPGKHIAAGRAMMPVVRVMCGLAARLASLQGTRAVCWHAAESWIEPTYFRRVIAAWLAGGPFPALGLAGFERTADGGLESHGLAYFIGRELRVEAVPGEDAAATARLAVRVADMLLRAGPIRESMQVAGLADETLTLSPEGNDRLRLMRGAWQH